MRREDASGEGRRVAVRLALAVALAACDAPPASMAPDAGRSEDLAAPAADLAPGPVDQATPPASLRVATINCHCLIEEPDARAAQMADALVALDADVVGLQEVCRTLGQDDDFAKRLVAALAARGRVFEARWVPTHVGWNQYDEGIGVLVREGWLVDVGELALPQGQGPFPRKALWTKLRTPSGEAHFYVTHLSHVDWQSREAQARALVAHADARARVPQVVVGDFNDEDWTAPVKCLTAAGHCTALPFVDAWAQARPFDPGETFTSTHPTTRIDYVFARGGLRAARAERLFTQPEDGLWASDHHGVFAVLDQ